MALAQDRNTPMKHEARTVSCPVAGATIIFKGAIVCANAAGYLVPADDVAGLVVMGVSDQHIDNSAGADGDVRCLVLKGVAGLRGGATAPTQADVGRLVMVEDDAGITTAAVATQDIAAGVLDSIDGGLFFVNLTNS